MNAKARGVELQAGATVVREWRQVMSPPGLIQRLVITRVPVLIGEGIPVFGALSRDIRLHHVATRHYPSGLVQSEYEVVTP